MAKQWVDSKIGLSAQASLFLLFGLVVFAPNDSAASSHACSLQVGTTCLEWEPDPELAPKAEPAPPKAEKPKVVTKPKKPPIKSKGLALSVGDRRRVQQALNILGFNVGAEDGLLGARSRDGLRRWQISNSYRGTGYLNRQQFAELTSAIKRAPLRDVAAEPKIKEPIVTPVPAADPQPAPAVAAANKVPLGQTRTHQKSFDDCYPGYRAKIKVVSTVLSSTQTRFSISARCGPWAANSGSCTLSNAENSNCSATAQISVSGSAPDVVVSGQRMFEDVGTADNLSAFSFRWKIKAW